MIPRIGCCVSHGSPTKLYWFTHTHLCSAHEGTEEYPFQGPLRFGDGDVRFRPSDINGGDEQGGHRTLSTTDDGVHEMPELEV